MLCSCASTPFIGQLSPQAARNEAQRDFRSGRPKIYLAGTRGASEVGVPEDKLSVVAGLPRSHRLSLGCDDPLASEHIEYARAYNEEIVRCLSSGRAG